MLQPACSVPLGVLQQQKQQEAAGTAIFFAGVSPVAPPEDLLKVFAQFGRVMNINLYRPYRGCKTSKVRALTQAYCDTWLLNSILILYSVTGWLNQAGFSTSTPCTLAAAWWPGICSPNACSGKHCPLLPKRLQQLGAPSCTTPASNCRCTDMRPYAMFKWLALTTVSAIAL
jgi:hypothetical protein